MVMAQPGSLICSLLVGVTLVLTGTAFAQYNTAEIGGVVTDTQGGVLPGATVVATNVARGFTVTRNTDGAGRFFLPGLPVGEYTLTVQLPGFRQFIQKGLMLRVGQKLDVSFTLEIGQLADAISVTGETPVLRTSNAEVNQVIDNRQVVELPLNGRQFLQLAQLAANVVIPPGGTRGAALEQAGSLPAVAGQRSGHNIYLIDGVKVTDEYFNNLVISPSVDAIQEFKIQETMYPPEFGGKASALINVVTKSGSNAFHGSALEFVRHDRLDARNYFDDPSKPIPPLRQHQFGANLGGPVRRDRTFFFVSYEGQRIRKSLTQTFSVPTAALRVGNFAGLPPICDPLTRTASGACTPFANNQIPAFRLDAVATALLQHVPLPTSGSTVQNLLAVGDEQNPMDQVTLRIDHRLTASDNVFGRFTSYDVRDDQPFGTSQLNETLVPGFGRVTTTKSRNLALSYTHTFSPSVLNEVRFGFLHASGGQVKSQPGRALRGERRPPGRHTGCARHGVPLMRSRRRPTRSATSN